MQVLTVSSATGAGLDVFSAIVSSGTSVLLGASGAGKSTLANSLLGRDVMEVQAAREVDGKGRHTTTSARRYVLDVGGAVVDTPGVKLFGLWGVTRENLPEFFPDVASGAAPEWRRARCNNFATTHPPTLQFQARARNTPRLLHAKRHRALRPTATKINPGPPLQRCVVSGIGKGSADIRPCH